MDTSVTAAKCHSRGEWTQVSQLQRMDTSVTAAENGDKFGATDSDTGVVTVEVTPQAAAAGGRVHDSNGSSRSEKPMNGSGIPAADGASIGVHTLSDFCLILATLSSVMWLPWAVLTRRRLGHLIIIIYLLKIVVDNTLAIVCAVEQDKKAPGTECSNIYYICCYFLKLIYLIGVNLYWHRMACFVLMVPLRIYSRIIALFCVVVNSQQSQLCDMGDCASPVATCSCPCLKLCRLSSEMNSHWRPLDGN